MRLVYISSPLRGDMEKNMEKAKDYCAYAASCGVIPLAPHTIFTQYLNDAVPEQREQGLRMGHELLERCDELWVMGDTISQGMKDEIGLATFLQLPILYVSDDMVKNQTMNNRNKLIELFIYIVIVVVGIVLLLTGGADDKTSAENMGGESYAVVLDE